MSLDAIWKQQLTLVTYGNEYLSQDLSFQHWIQHPIFNQHVLNFRDLLNQHLLAQHFQIWLEGLKKQGVTRLSLHSAELLNDEQNPNANIELLPISHVIISHKSHTKQAWMLGKELAEWYTADNDYEAPKSQTEQLRHETFWCYELNAKLIKKIDTDLTAPNWDDIQQYTEQELFLHPYSHGFSEPLQQNSPYYGYAITPLTPENSSAFNTQPALFPTQYSADYAHQTLHRLEALTHFIQQKIQHPYDANGVILPPEEQLNLRHFSQKLDDLTAKFIVKVGNHYQTAKLTPATPVASPLHQSSHETTKQSHGKVGKTSVFTLIIITIILCVCAYYFGL